MPTKRHGKIRGASVRGLGKLGYVGRSYSCRPAGRRAILYKSISAFSTQHRAKACPQHSEPVLLTVRAITATYEPPWKPGTARRSNVESLVLT